VISENKSYIAAAAASCLVLVALVFEIYLNFRGVVIEQTRAQLLASATEAAADLDQFLADRAELVQLALANPLVRAELAQGGERPVLSQTLQELLRLHADSIGTVEIYGEQLHLLERTPAALQWPDAALNPLLERALRQREVVIGEHLLWRGARAYASVLVPLQAHDKPFVARVLVQLQDVLQADLGHRREFDSAYGWALARDGTMVWHPAPGQIGQPMLSELDRLAPRADPTALIRVLEDMRAGKAGSATYEFSAWRRDPRERMQKIVGYAPVSAFGGALSVAVGVEYQEIAGPINGYAIWIGLLGIAIVLVAATAGLLYLRGSRRAQAAQRELLAQLRHVLSVSPAGVYHLKRGASGELSELVGSWQDITDGQEAQSRLRLADRLFENASEAAFVTDHRRRHLRINPAYTRLTGYTIDELRGRECPVVRPEFQDADFVEVVDRSIAAEGSWRGEVRLRRKNGEFFPGWMSLSAVQDQQGKLSHYVGLISDLSAQRELEQTVQRLSHYDPITGLPNRVLLMQHLRQECDEAAHRHERLGVLLLDLDRFKQINESLGRSVGDAILKQVAIRLQYGLQASALLSQPGGDQFVVVLPDLRSAAQATNIAAEICRLIGEPLKLEDNIQLDLSVSIGISLYPDDGDEPAALLQHAEAAMHHVKANGGGTFYFYTADMNERSVRRLKLVQALREAIPRGELRLAYQPQMALTSGRIVGMEALLRWQNPELGMVSPAEFIPLAEESGLIVPMGEWVLREACRQAAVWQRTHGALRVGVNLSLRQFQAGTLQATVAAVLEETGLDPALLELEITESLAMADPEGTIKTLDGLRELGIRLALDDFGTGYSSLAYLQRLPLDTLKIDRAFIEHLDSKHDDLVLTSTIISMAHALGLSVIAEGVEDLRQQQILQEHQCDEIQGYYLSRPLLAEEFAAWLREYRPKRRPALEPA
jgi:diguanylate cyclase (GGDEF)-like protein/PAS domain S-box-containing protein